MAERQGRRGAAPVVRVVGKPQALGGIARLLWAAYQARQREAQRVRLVSDTTTAGEVAG